MKISSQNSIEDIKTEFANSFPNLKIEFYSKIHKEGEGSQKKNEYSSQRTIKEISNNESGEIVFSANKTVKEVEQAFESEFGIHAQIFRKSGEVWIQSTNSDSWTLEQQNKFNSKK